MLTPEFLLSEMPQGVCDPWVGRGEGNDPQRVFQDSQGAAG